jgi:hypothetical protein
MHPSCTNNSVRALKKKRFGGCLLKLDVAAWKVLTKDQDGQGCKMEEKPRQHGQALIDEHGEPLGPRCSWRPNVCALSARTKAETVALVPSRISGSARHCHRHQLKVLETPPGALCHAVTPLRAWTRARTQSASRPGARPHFSQTQVGEEGEPRKWVGPAAITGSQQPPPEGDDDLDRISMI